MVLARAHCLFLVRFFSPLPPVQHKTKLVVASRATCDPEDDAASSQQELSDDFLSIVTVFVAKNNGRRAAENQQPLDKIACKSTQPVFMSDNNLSHLSFANHLHHLQETWSLEVDSRANIFYDFMVRIFAS